MSESDRPTDADVRKGQGSVTLSRRDFLERYRLRFADPAFDDMREEIARLAERAFEAYTAYRKAPRTRAAGERHADPAYELSVEWLAARDAIEAAQRRHDDAAAPRRVLLVCAASRSDETCPGEMSKTFRLAGIAREALEQDDVVVDLLDLSHLASEYGRVIYPCKACVSTAMPLCHWPCSCYPNHALGQVGDWMNEIYPRWVEAHGVMIVSPVYWYQATSPLKLMMDRLVCADGGNPDPTTTRGKDPALAKRIELDGWDFPRHLAGRAFAVVVHGDTEGATGLRQNLTDWLREMQLVQAGRAAVLDRYIGYYGPYATSHDALDQDPALHEEVRIVARSLAATVRALAADPRQPDDGLEGPRPK
ncbi:MAG TPA: NAD(P)H-dependent oxidoreductase [Xanthomonadales bacterium]|nr:NAD(P)H-dependent oxidoreductase [Xanthomonadales bacterium]